MPMDTSGKVLSSQQSRVAAQVRELNRTGVEKMRHGALEDALSTLQVALSMTSDIVSGQSPVDPSSNNKPLMKDDDDPKGGNVEIIGARATTLSNLGCLYRRMGQLSEAVHHLQAARDIEATLQSTTTSDGMRSSGSCSTMLNLCTVLIAMDRIEEALGVAYRCAERAAADAAASAEALAAADPAASSPPTSLREAASTAAYLHALSLHNLGVAQQSSDKKEERRHASTTMMRALEVARCSLGDQHPTTVMLRVKCGVPNVPAPNQGPQTAKPSAQGGATALVPRAPGGSKPSGGMNNAQRGGVARSEMDAARDALRQLGGSAVYQPIPQSNQDRPSLRDEKSVAVSESAVMEGAAFTNPSEGGASGEGGSGPMKTVDDENVEVVDVTTVAAQLRSTTTTTTTTQQLVTQPPEASLHSVSTVLERPPSSMANRLGASAVMTSNDHYLRAGSSMSPAPSQAQTPRRSPAHQPRSHMASSHTSSLVLHRTATSSDRPPAFMRFAPNSAAPPPAPTSFAEIRQELRLEKEQRRQAAVMQERANQAPHGGGTGVHGGARLLGEKPGAGAGGCATSVVERKKAKALQEEAEELLLRERMKAEEQRAKVEAAHRAKEEAQLQERRHKAARRIQRCYRAWWHRVGFNISLQRKKQKQDQQRSTHRGNARSPARAIAGGAGGGSEKHGSIPSGSNQQQTRLSRAVVRCAQKWLRFSFKRLLLFRLSGGRGNEARQRVENCIRVAQRCWRCKLSRRRAAALRAFRDETATKIAASQHRNRAARQIQCAFRVFMARRSLAVRRKNRYWRPAVNIQRWYRWRANYRAQAGQRAQGLYYRVRAAIAIQRVWRGYLGRLRAVMVRLKRKVQIMRDKDISRSVAIQRVARGYQTRNAVRRAKHEKDETNRAAMVSALAMRTSAARSVPCPEEQARIAALQQSERYQTNALQHAASVDRLRNREREEHHIPIAINAQAERHRQDYTRLVPFHVRLERAEEMDRRAVELKTLQRHRAARRIQKYYRRWRRQCTAEATGRRAIAALSYERTMVGKRETRNADAAESSKLRALNDLGAEPRALVGTWRAETAQLEDHVNYHLPDVSSSRSIEHRASVSKDLKSKEIALGREMHTDHASLRAAPTFMTQRQRKLLVEQREAVAATAQLTQGAAAPNIEQCS